MPFFRDGHLQGIFGWWHLVMAALGKPA